MSVKPWHLQAGVENILQMIKEQVHTLQSLVSIMLVDEDKIWQGQPPGQ